MVCFIKEKQYRAFSCNNREIFQCLNNYTYHTFHLIKVNKNYGSSNLEYLQSPDISYDVYEKITQLLYDSDLHFSGTKENFCNRLVSNSQSGMCRSLVIMDGEDVVSHASTLLESDSFVIIGAVITNPRYRKRGFAEKIIKALSSILMNENKKVYLFSANVNLTRYYQKIGFKVCTEWYRGIMLEKII